MQARASGLVFEYEKELPLEGKSYTIHPDFTIELDGRTYYLEHLGKLDAEDYYKNWAQRKQDYINNDYYENLITTDDLNGVSEEVVSDLIQDMLRGELVVSADERFSKHHYRLCPRDE